MSFYYNTFKPKKCCSRHIFKFYVLAFSVILNSYFVTYICTRLYRTNVLFYHFFSLKVKKTIYSYNQKLHTLINKPFNIGFLLHIYDIIFFLTIKKNRQYLI